MPRWTSPNGGASIPRIWNERTKGGVSIGGSATIAARVDHLLAAENDSPQALQRALEAIAAAFAAATATLHRTDPATDPLRPDLVTVAGLGLPEAVQAQIRRIPFGRGMAGLCAQRRAPVSVCNLQTDDSGVVRPGAKDTGVAGALVIPIFDAAGELIGTLGVGRPAEQAYSEEERRLLAACAEKLAGALAACPLAAD